MRGVLQPGNFEFVERVLFDEGEFTNNSNRNLYLTDQIGSVRDVLDIGQQPVGSSKGNGKLVQASDYRPYGRIERQFVDSTSPATLFQYAGLQWDEDAGLYLSYTRAYDARIGRWVNRDPIREAGGVNIYGYVGGRPHKFFDPLGNSGGPPSPLGLALELVFHADDAGPGSTLDEPEDAKGGAYTLRDPITDEVLRSGRTNDFERRSGEHARDPELKDLRFDRTFPTDDYNEQRGLEDLLHNKFDPPMDKIKPISPRNKKGPDYRKAAEDYIKRRICRK